jgi:hypothetical protein
MTAALAIEVKNFTMGSYRRNVVAAGIKHLRHAMPRRHGGGGNGHHKTFLGDET